MRWASAKNIIIFILLGLNIFLAVNLYIYNSDGGSASEAEASVLNILSSRNIKITCKIPSTRGSAKRLNFINDGYDKVKLADKLLGLTVKQASDMGEGTVLKNGDKQLEILSAISFSYTDARPEDLVDTTKASEVEKFAVKFLKSKGLMPKYYMKDAYITNPDKSIKVLFIEKNGGNLIFDNYLEVSVTTKGITEIEGSRRSIKKAEVVQQDMIMTALQVLLRYYADYSNKVITGIDLGYKESSISVNNMKASSEEPVWRIRIQDSNEPRYFNAFNGDEVK